MTTSTAGIGGILPEQYGPIIVEPVARQSVAMQVATVLSTGQHAMNVPVVTEDPTAAWVAEGAEITPDDGALAEITITPRKVAGLTIVSRELADDSTPGALGIVGDGLARSIADQVDRAFFGSLSSPAPAGLESVSGLTTITGPTAWTNLDPFAEAVATAEGLGTTITSFVAHPTDALALAQIKDETGSNRPLLGSDPTMPTRRVMQGVPLLTSPRVTEGTVWALPKDRTLIVRRQDVDLQVSTDAYFTSDRVAIRAIMRIGFGFPHAAAIVRVQLDDEA
jgi:HK97 family phage major capsid protein